MRVSIYQNGYQVPAQSEYDTVVLSLSDSLLANEIFY